MGSVIDSQGPIFGKSAIRRSLAEAQPNMPQINFVALGTEQSLQARQLETLIHDSELKIPSIRRQFEFAERQTIEGIDPSDVMINLRRVGKYAAVLALARSGSPTKAFEVYENVIGLIIGDEVPVEIQPHVNQSGGERG